VGARLILLTTSWPSVRSPWAGHFVADLARHLARSRPVTVVAPAWAGDGGALGRPGVTLIPARLPGAPGSLAARPAWGGVVLASLRRAAREAARAARPGPAPLWMAHWWPTAWAAPRGAIVTTVLHGSDVDLLERLPRPVARRALRPGPLVAVAPHLLRRALALRRGAWAWPTRVCPLGARVAPGRRSLGTDAGWWTADPRPRVLTVARPAPGKGLAVARAAAELLPGVAWLVLGARAPVAPAAVRAALRWADLCVVPSEAGPMLPREGRPHVIAQALAAGVPVLGGPNEAVREALGAAGQREVRHPGAQALAQAVRAALEPAALSSLRRAARAAGAAYTWPAVLPGWEAMIRAGGVEVA